MIQFVNRNQGKISVPYSQCLAWPQGASSFCSGLLESVYQCPDTQPVAIRLVTLPMMEITFLHGQASVITVSFLLVLESNKILFITSSGSKTNY